jgi:acyl-CoA thioester hydrolase
MARCEIFPGSSAEKLAIVVSSFAQYFSSLSYPMSIDAGLRVNKIGRSSVEYEVGIFGEGKANPAIVGGFVHVFVDGQSGKPTSLSKVLREGLHEIYVPKLARL